jgi:uncharacterized protein (TIGR02284 family)
MSRDTRPGFFLRFDDHAVSSVDPDPLQTEAAMPDRDDRWVLNHLIELCRDEELTLKYAAEHASEDSLKKLFSELAAQRAQFAEDLVPHAQRLGGASAAGATTRGGLHRSWLALKETVGGHQDRRIIAEAKHGEDQALAAYEDALNHLLPPSTRDIVEEQSMQIRMAHGRVRALLEAAG